MARLLYVFPHPDDESFGPGPAIVRQRREGHEVYVLTLTRGEATKERHKHGLSKEAMGRQRVREMDDVARTLGLTDLTVLDFEDGSFKDCSPLALERAVRAHVERVRPEVLVTYAVHGISGHPDHLVGHAVVKRVFCQLRDEGAAYLRRLAFFTLRDLGDPARPAHLKSSPDAAIDCLVRFSDEDRARGQAALECYVTYLDVVRAHNPLAQVEGGVAFELFGEAFDPPLDDLTARLPTAASASS